MQNHAPQTKFKHRSSHMLVYAVEHSVVLQKGDRITLSGQHPVITHTETELVMTQRDLTISSLAHKHIHPDSLRYPDSEPRITLEQAIADAIGIPPPDRIDITRRELAEEPSITGHPTKASSTRCPQRARRQERDASNYIGGIQSNTR